MTAATTMTAPRPTLEELVDRLIDAIFGDEAPTTPTTSLARGIHEARQLRRAGDLDGALAAFAGLETEGATDGERRWAYAEFLDLARRSFRDEDGLIYSPSSGRAAVLTPCDDGPLEVRAVLEHALATGQARLAAQPQRTQSRSAQGGAS